MSARTILSYSLAVAALLIVAAWTREPAAVAGALVTLVAALEYGRPARRCVSR